MGKPKWEFIDESNIRRIVKSSKSNREVASKLGYYPDGGGTMKILRNMYDKLGIDTSHFSGQRWSKG